MINWPAILPDPIWDSINLGPTEGAVIRTPMDGPAKTRPRFTAAPRPLSMDFKLTEGQFVEFERFFDGELRLGALIFEMKHPISGAARSFRFVTDSGGYSAVPIGKDAIQLSVQLELLP